MADKAIGALDAASGVFDDTLFAAEQQGRAVRVTGRQLRELSGGGAGNTPGDSSGGGDTSTGGTGGGFVEMETSIPVTQRRANTLYGLILEQY